MIMYYYDGPMMDGSNWGWGALTMLVWLVFFVIIAMVVLRLLRGHEITPHGGPDPQDTIKQRYAKGEITKEEFEQLKKDLK